MDNPQNPGHLEELLRPGHRRSPLPHSVYREQGSQEFIVISMAVLTAEPANHQLLLSAAFLFADTWSGISVVERSLTYGTNMGVLTALNKNTKILLEDQCVV